MARTARTGIRLVPASRFSASFASASTRRALLSRTPHTARAHPLRWTRGEGAATAAAKAAEAPKHVPGGAGGAGPRTAVPAKAKPTKVILKPEDFYSTRSSKVFAVGMFAVIVGVNSMDLQSMAPAPWAALTSKLKDGVSSLNEADINEALNVLKVLTQPDRPMPAAVAVRRVIGDARLVASVLWASRVVGQVDPRTGMLQDFVAEDTAVNALAVLHHCCVSGETDATFLDSLLAQDLVRVLYQVATVGSRRRGQAVAEMLVTLARETSPAQKLAMLRQREFVLTLATLLNSDFYAADSVIQRECTEAVAVLLADEGARAVLRNEHAGTVLAKQRGSAHPSVRVLAQLGTELLEHGAASGADPAAWRGELDAAKHTWALAAPAVGGVTWGAVRWLVRAWRCRVRGGAGVGGALGRALLGGVVVAGLRGVDEAYTRTAQHVMPTLMDMRERVPYIDMGALAVYAAVVAPVYYVFPYTALPHMLLGTIAAEAETFDTPDEMVETLQLYVANAMGLWGMMDGAQ